jgi:hypothetical protein
MMILVFFIGTMFGLLIGAVACVRYVRQEMMARIEPTIDLMQMRLTNVQSSVDLALAAWHAEMHRDHQDRIIG